MDFQALTDQLQTLLPPKKFLHALGVTHTAVALAERHGVATDWAALAGLLHDRSKAMAPEEIERDLARRGIGIPEDDKPYPAIWHGLHAAVWARQDLGLSEADGIEDIAEAVQFHSTAEADISPLAKVLFIADIIEPSRSFEGIESLRRVAHENLDEGFRTCLARKCAYVKRQRGAALSPRAVRALEFYGTRNEADAESSAIK